MSKNRVGKGNRPNRENRGNRRKDRYVELPSDHLPTPRTQKTTKPLTAQTDAQASYMNAIDVYPLTFGLGPAGTGKTYIAASIAATMFMNKKVDKIIITRPAVESEEEFGFLPGDMDEKFAPYLAPVRAILEERMGAGAVEYALAAKQIEIMPLAFLRGHTFKNCVVLFDEAQNSTPNQMRLFLTRIGENCRVIIDGDLDQMDIKGKSGLLDAVERLTGASFVGVVEFTTDDIVRSGIQREILLRYSNKGTPIGNSPGLGFLANSAH